MRRSPSPTLRFSPALNRPVVAPNCWARVLEVGEVVVALDLVAELDQPDAALLEHQGVVVPLVPALEPELAGLLVHDLHAEGVRVVVAGFFEVGHPKVDVPEPDDGTCLTHLPLPFTSFVADVGAGRGPPSEALLGVRIGESEDPPEPVTFLELDDDVRDRDGPAAQADPLDALVVTEHARGDRALVADLPSLSWTLQIPQPPRLQPTRYRSPARASARSSVSPSAAVTRTPSGRMVTSAIRTPPSCAMHPDRAEPVELRGRDTPGVQRHGGRQAAGQHDRPGLDALAPGRRAPRPARPAPRPDGPSRRRRPRCRSLPRYRKTQPRTSRSTSSSGGAARVPRTTRAAPALSATESGRRKGSQ